MSLYKCECGKEFDAAQRFNGHKSHCKIHLGSVGKLESYGDRQARASATGRKAYNTQLKVHKQQLLDLWIAERHKCERCGKIMTEKFGSGRFCSRACANARNHSEETKEKIRKGLNKETKCFCQYCGKEFNTLTAKASHEKLCKSNPNRLENPSTQYKDKLQRKVVLHRYGENKKDKVVLDITYAELEQYKESHTVCEICGRSVTETIKWKSKYAAKTLCIDHDHKNNKFRGMLCHNCNTKLGWYEIYQGKINEYLSK